MLGFVQHKSADGLFVELPVQVSLTSPEGRARALCACEALRLALRAERAQPQARRRLAAVRERTRRLHKAKDQVRRSPRYCILAIEYLADICGLVVGHRFS